MVRRALLKGLLLVQDKRIRIADYVEAAPRDLVAAVREQRLEGIVGKQKDSHYQPGKRSGAWIKYRVNRGQEFVIGGYFPGPHGFDSLNRITQANNTAVAVDSTTILQQVQRIRTSLERVKTMNRKVTDVRASANEIQTEAEALRDEVRASLTVIEDALRTTAPTEKKTLFSVAR